jgi:translation initiation factor 5
MSVNIGRENASDPFYRYKMPVVHTQILKPNTHGSRTVVRHLADVASALNADLSHELLAKYLSYALGAKEETSKGQTELAGMYTSAAIMELVQDFADEFARCPKCRDPELDLKMHKGGIRATCRACSFNGKLFFKRKPAQKLEEFLTKQVRKARKIEEQARTTHESKDRQTGEGSEPQNAGSESKQETAADRKKVKAKKKTKTPDPDDVVWFTDTSPEAQASRRQEELALLSTKAAALELLDMS